MGDGKEGIDRVDVVVAGGESDKQPALEGRRKKGLGKKLFWVIFGVVVVAVSLVAELILVAPMMSNDIDISEYWAEVVSGRPYFYEDKIYYVVGSGVGGYKRVGEYGEIARMDLDGKNREVLVSHDDYGDSWGGVSFVGVVEGELLYLKDNYKGDYLLALDIKGEGAEVREVTSGVEGTISMSDIKDGWVYYLRNKIRVRTELSSGKTETVGDELNEPSGLVVEDGYEFFILDGLEMKVMKVDIESGEVVDEVEIDDDDFEGNLKTVFAGSLNGEIVYILLGSMMGKDVNKVYAVGVDDMKVRYVSDSVDEDVEIFEYSADGYVYTVSRRGTSEKAGGGSRYEIQKKSVEDYVK